MRSIRTGLPKSGALIIELFETTSPTCVTWPVLAVTEGPTTAQSLAADPDLVSRPGHGRGCR